MYLGVTAGLIDGRHHERLGAAWMLFLWCCLRQTGQGEEGIVCRGAVVTYAEIAAEMNCKRGNIREWMRRLIEQKYIRVERDRAGIRIFIRNPKKMRVSKVQPSKPVVIVETPHSRVSELQHSKRIHAAENAASSEILLRSDLTKLLKNNNTTAAAKSAAVSISSLAKAKSIPREMSQAELEERQRLLHRQSKELLARFPANPPTLGTATP
jgi:hypothetical protein